MSQISKDLIIMVSLGLVLISINAPGYIFTDNVVLVVIVLTFLSIILAEIICKYRTLNKEEEKKSIEERKPVPSLYIWSMAGIGCVILWLGGETIIFKWSKSVMNFEPSAFGDSFGAINALISALAFAGVIVTFILQKKELELQRYDMRESKIREQKALELQRTEFQDSHETEQKMLELQKQELQNTQEEVKKQAQQLEEQNKTMRLQVFHSTLFHLFEMQESITNNISYKNPDGADYYEGSGRDVFKYLYCDKIYQFGDIDGVKKELRGIKDYLNVFDINKLNIVILDCFRIRQYFSHLFRIIMFIDSNEDISDSQKDMYVSMLDTQLSEFEILVLFYFSLCNDTYKNLFKKYHLYRLVDTRDLAEKDHFDFYEAHY